MRSILVTGAGGSAGNNVCWSLRISQDGKDWTITGTDSDRTNLQLNNWVDSAYHMPPATSPKYVGSINRVLEQKKVEIIFPQPDLEVEKLSENREQIRAQLYLPDSDTVRICLDKYQSLGKWARAGLRKQSPVILSHNNNDINRAIQTLNYPCWIRARHGAGGLLSSLAKNPETVRHWVYFHWDQGIETDFIVEDYLPGRDYCFMSLWNDGSLVTSMVRERLSWVGNRLIGTGGTSRLNRVVHSQTVNDHAMNAIKSLTGHAHGIFCVDLKEDNQAVPRPTEINCRFTTNVHYLALASIRKGRVEWNFPWVAARIALGEPLPRCEKFNALPEGIYFTKNTDMGFTMITDEKWKAIEI